MKAINEYLDAARYHIDGGVDCRTPEYHALDHMERAVRLLAAKLDAADKMARQAANTASCLANEIQPD